MSIRRSVTVLSVLLYVILVTIGTVAVAQGFGPEAYGIPGPFGLGAPIPVRELGMGIMLSCVNDHQFANPAFAAWQQTSSAAIRQNTTSFSSGPCVQSTLVQYALPLRCNETGMQISLLTLRGSGGNAQLPQVGPVATRMNDNGWVVDYGRRLRPRLRVGLSILGNENMGFGLTSPLAGTLINLDAQADIGARVGAAYEWQPGTTVGLLYSYAQESVSFQMATETGPVVGEWVYHNNQLSLGVSHQFSPRLLGAVEFQRGTTWRAPFCATGNAWHWGVEYCASPEWALRAGLSDGDPTFGLGYANDHWTVGYAYIHNWDSTDVGQLFGNSKTHSLQVGYQF